METEIKEAAKFMTRMLPFLTSGMSFEEAGNAVLNKDKELFNKAMANDEVGEAIRNGLMKETYLQVKG